MFGVGSERLAVGGGNDAVDAMVAGSLGNPHPTQRIPTSPNGPLEPLVNGRSLPSLSQAPGRGDPTPPISDFNLEAWFASNRIGERGRDEIEDACRRCGYDLRAIVRDAAAHGANSAADILTWISGAWTKSVDGDEFDRRADEWKDLPRSTKDDLRDLAASHSLRPKAGFKFLQFVGRPPCEPKLRRMLNVVVEAGWDVSCFIEGVQGESWDSFEMAVRRA